MSPVIKQLFQGEITPAETIIPQDPEYGILWGEIEKIMNRLSSTYPQEAQALARLELLWNDASVMDTYAGFSYGLKLGIHLTWEAKFE